MIFANEIEPLADTDTFLMDSVETISMAGLVIVMRRIMIKMVRRNLEKTE